MGETICLRMYLVIGTGTIGEPLIGLLADHKDSLGLDNVIFFKRTPLSDERGKVESLIRKGAKLFLLVMLSAIFTN